jgi:hypothetical protein
MVEKSAISFVTILVPLLVLRISKLPLTISLMCLCNYIGFVAVVSTMGGGLPALLDEGCCNSLLRSSDVPSARVRSTSIYAVFEGANKFFVGTSPFGRSMGSLDSGVGTLVLDFFAFSSEGFRLRLICSGNSSVDFCSAGRTESRNLTFP